jgi:hypothetical protein
MDIRIFSAAGADVELDKAIDKAQAEALIICESRTQEGYFFSEVKVQTFFGGNGKYVHVLTLIHARSEDAPSVRPPRPEGPQ